ncbi:uncharacterized protein LOC141619015 [Silene latifolia]|uniref:uncharacterized protein LOC141619015 n=1 Tax=Silene latifolia TaxID=37657 RepID=UPI003D76DB21
MDPIKYLFGKPVLNGRMSRCTLMLSEFDLKYVPLKVIKGMGVVDFLADNPIKEIEVIDTRSFPDEDVVHVENDVWDLYFNGASNYMGYGVGILLILPTSEHALMSNKLDFNVTNNAAEYEACLLDLRNDLQLGVKKLIKELEKYFEDIRYVHLSREENQFAVVLSKLAALINNPDHIDNMPICVERRSSPAYVNAIDDAEEGETEPWYTTILKFKEKGEYPPDLDTCGKRALRMSSAQFICTDDGQLYKKTVQGVLLRCIDKPTTEKDMKEVHDGEYGTHMNAHMLVHKIIRLGIDIIGKVNPSETGGHCFILVAIDYFTKWVEAKSYQVLKVKKVAHFIQNDIICRYGVPHEFISDHGAHFQVEAAVINEKHKRKHQKSSPYRPQTNGAVEAANKTVTFILRKMSYNYTEWLEKIPFALRGYRTSIRTATGAAPYCLVYGMEAVQPVELEVPSLRILLKSRVPEADWVQARYDSLVMLNERCLNALYHVQLDQKRIERAFNKKVKPRGISEGDLVLKLVRALLPINPRGKFKPNWAGPYLVKKILSGGAVRLTDLDRNDYTNPVNLDQLKEFYP